MKRPTTVNAKEYENAALAMMKAGLPETADRLKSMAKVRQVKAIVIAEDENDTTVRITRSDGSTVDVLIPRPDKDTFANRTAYEFGDTPFGLNLVSSGHYE